MKKIFFALLTLASLFMVSCGREEIVFDHEKPQFETKANAILLEVIVPAGTSAKDQIYIVGAFNGKDTIDFISPDYQLQVSENNTAKYGIYLYPEDFVDGKTLADGFLFVSKMQGIEKPAELHFIQDAKLGERYDISLTRWGGAAVVPDVEHDGFAVFVIDETGWDALALYAWGDGEIFGGWPGIQPTGTQIIDGISYKYFDFGEANTGLLEHLIFNNNGGGVQLKDFDFTIERDLFLRLTADGVEEISNEPEIEHDGTAVYVLNAIGWETVTLYMYGDENNLNGGWPGMEATGTQTINGFDYIYFDLGAANDGLAEHLIFNNGGNGEQIPGSAEPYITLQSGEVYYYRINADKSVTVIEDPKNPNAEPEPEPVEKEETTVTVYVENLTGWDCFSVYAYGGAEYFGGWPGAAGDATETIDGVTYFKYTFTGLTTDEAHLIFTNKGCLGDEGAQYDACAFTITKDAKIFVTANPDGAVVK